MTRTFIFGLFRVISSSTDDSTLKINPVVTLVG